jgi:hypothetical protein
MSSIAGDALGREWSDRAGMGTSSSEHGVRVSSLRPSHNLHHTPSVTPAGDVEVRFLIDYPAFTWGGGRVVEGARLLSEYAGNARIEGSNPSLSAEPNTVVTPVVDGYTPFGARL